MWTRAIIADDFGYAINDILYSVVYTQINAYQIYGCHTSNSIKSLFFIK